MNKKKIFLIEDHSETYFILKKRNLINHTLIHIDAHLDYQKESNAENNPSMINIGNFIYPILNKNITKQIYWVVPGRKQKFWINAFLIKRELQNLQKQNKNDGKEIEYLNNSIHTKISGRKLIICSLDSLPDIRDKSILDIDLDYFINPSLQNTYPDNLNKKKWITTSKFVKKISEKIKRPKIILICYSTNGGWTPMIYKHIGDELAWKLGHQNTDTKQRILAGHCFQKFRKAIKSKNLVLAKKYYQTSIKLNPKYNSLYNNNCFIYLKKRKYSKAQKEISFLRQVAPQNSIFLLIQGLIYLKKRKYDLARKYFRKSYKNNPYQIEALLYLACISIYKKDYKQAKIHLNKYSKTDQKNGFTFLLKSYVEKQLNHVKKSENYFLDFLKSKKVYTPFGLESIINYLNLNA